MIDPHIFRAYDIRGKALTQLTEEAAELIGHAFGTVVCRTTKKEHPVVALGWDARTHSPLLQAAAKKGLLAAGCEVLVIGQTPSPVNYFTICAEHLDGGVQITASHNPKEDNGMKLQLHDAEAHAGEDLQKLHRQILAQDFIHDQGSEREFDAVTPYMDHLTRLFPGKGQGLHVVVDSGNGVAGPVYCEVLKRVGCTLTELFTEPDGTFPNHPADPSKHATLKDLQAKVKETGAHFGLAFDGDGDRVGFVDETGAIRSADDVLLLLAQDHLSRHEGKPVVFTVSNSGTLETEVKKWGGEPVMCKVGHSFVEHTMREHGALLGGEQSGHFFCGEDYFGFDDALMAALRLVSIVQAGKRPCSELFAQFPKVFQAPERRPHCPDNLKTAVISAVTKHFSATHSVITLDGVRIDFGDGAWAGIRQSNTSPCLSLCLEARSPEKLKEIETVVLTHMTEYPEVDFNSH